MTYRPGQRFDAGEAWLNRRKAGTFMVDHSQCDYCRVSTRTKSEKAGCRMTARHFASVYNLSYGKEVQSAAFVVQKLGRDAIRPVEAIVEQRLRVDERLHTARPAGRLRLITAFRQVLTGRRLLRIVQHAIKLQERIRPMTKADLLAAPFDSNRTEIANAPRTAGVLRTGSKHPAPALNIYQDRIALTTATPLEVREDIFNYLATRAAEHLLCAIGGPDNGSREPDRV